MQVCTDSQLYCHNIQLRSMEVCPAVLSVTSTVCVCGRGVSVPNYYNNSNIIIQLRCIEVCPALLSVTRHSI